jgi:hypothetical protein
MPADTSDPPSVGWPLGAYFLPTPPRPQPARTPPTGPPPRAQIRHAPAAADDKEAQRRRRAEPGRAGRAHVRQPKRGEEGKGPGYRHWRRWRAGHGRAKRDVTACRAPPPAAARAATPARREREKVNPRIKIGKVQRVI